MIYILYSDTSVVMDDWWKIINKENFIRLTKGLTYMNGHKGSKVPCIRDPKELPNNKIAAFGKLKSTERNSNHAEMYSSQIQDVVEGGVVQKITQDEIDSYKGPVFYLSYHEILKPDSESTPC